MEHNKKPIPLELYRTLVRDHDKDLNEIARSKIAKGGTVWDQAHTLLGHALKHNANQESFAPKE